MAKKKVVRNSLNTVLRLEPILLSLTLDNYEMILAQLLEGLQVYDEVVYDKLNRFKWLVESQLGSIPTVSTLKTEFPELNFDNVEVFSSVEELTDYVHLYLTQKKQQYLSVKFLNYSDVVRGSGLTNDMIEDIYKSLSLAEVDVDFDDIRDSYRDLYKGLGHEEGLSFLCPALDDLTGGISNGELCTILGASGSMKTTYSSNIAFNAVKEGKNVLYLSLEEQPMKLYSKWLSRASVDIGKPLPAIDIVQRNLDEKDEKILFDEVLPYFEGLPGRLYIVGEQELGDYSLTSFESKFKEIDKLAIEQTGHGVDLLVVDHIQLIKFAVTNMDPTTVINMYVSFFRQQCLSWLHEKRSIAVILLSQANRDGLAYAKRNNGAYLANHVAEASEVIRASSYIISVYTDDKVQFTKLLVVGAVKLRGSQLPPGTINVFADGEFYQVGDAVVRNKDYSMDELMGGEVENKKELTMEAVENSGVFDPFSVV